MAQRRGRDRVLVRDGPERARGSRRYRTAISTELPDGLPRILREADAKLRTLRAEGHRDAGGLAVAADATHARRVAKLLGEVTGRAPLVVLHTEAGAARKLADFRGSREPWIVAVNMVSEGVDIPRLRVGVYATAAKTPLIFRQIVGRFVRTIPGRAAEPSWLYLPAEQTLRSHASEIETELRHALRRDELEEGLEEPPERRASEPSPHAEFVPLSAEFAAQMTLFGAPQRAPSPPPANNRRHARASPGRGVRAPRGTCARNAAVWWRNCTAATVAATARSTPGSTARSGSSASMRRASSSSSARSRRSSAS